MGSRYLGIRISTNRRLRFRVGCFLDTVWAFESHPQDPTQVSKSEKLQILHATAHACELYSKFLKGGYTREYFGGEDIRRVL